MVRRILKIKKFLNPSGPIVYDPYARHKILQAFNTQTGEVEGFFNEPVITPNGAYTPVSSNSMLDNLILSLAQSDARNAKANYRILESMNYRIHPFFYKVLPLAASPIAAEVSGAISTGLSALRTAVPNMAVGALGGEVVNRGMKNAFGYTWGEGINQLSRGYIPTWAGEFTNPGYLTGGLAKPLGNVITAGSNITNEALARANGIVDATKYGIYDRVLGYNLYNKFLKGKDQYFKNLFYDSKFDLFKDSKNVGLPGTISDESGKLFMVPATYTRSEVLNSGPASIRMGFNANNGKLSRNLVSQGKEAIDKLPSGTSISADSHGLSVPSRLASEGNREGIIKTLLRGTSDAETTLSNLEKRLGEDPGTFIRNPYDMSADAHRFFTLEAQKPGRRLVYAGRSGLWNNAAVSNPLVYKWLTAYNNRRMSARDYVRNYNNWVKEFGGRPGHVDITGKPYFYHPTIFITGK